MQGSRFNVEAFITLLPRISRLTIILVSLIVLALFCARFVWFFAVGPNFNEAPPAIKSGRVNSLQVSSVDVSMLSRITPFRTLQNEPVLAVTVQQPDAPETELDITLNGVRADGDGGGIAFITVGGGVQKRYKQGDPLEGLRNVSVDSIFADGVLLTREGRLERLSNFHDDDIGIKSANESTKSKQMSAVVEHREVPAKSVKPAPSKTSSQALIIATSDMARAEIEDILNWARFDANTVDNMPGVTVFPLNSAVFVKSGLKARDTVQSINGIELSPDTDYEAMISSLEKTTRADIILVRNGRAMKLTVNVLE
ncbi:type II secretion system protein N [Hirschia litorea]|uniref:Type II secretion system protein N n=1 Tax=Hirschia litorea TaxID=1199156 RepID=A0ABW2IGX1_9PROT